MNQQTRFVLKKLELTDCRSILNIGYRHDSDQTILDWASATGRTFDVLEIYTPNCEYLKSNKKISAIYNLGAHQIASLEKKWDAIIWLHGPEHVKWEEFLNMRSDIESCANDLVIYQAPEGEFPQEDIYGNVYERHVSTLREKMFADLGYKTNNFGSGEPTFSAWIEK